MRYILFLFMLFNCALLHAESTTSINQKFINRVEAALSDDKMQGRKTFTTGIERASQFIENEFAAIGLEHFSELSSYRQEFVIQEQSANNVIGVLTGKTRPNEYVIFSAHYDHLGTIDFGPDKIFNGANDDASGVTAVIALADHFKKQKNNERTLIFIAFTAEEIGGYGSKYFAKHIAADKVVAMINIEMIGTESKWGKNSAYVTGYEKSSLGELLNASAPKNKFRFYSDPYSEQELFYRSDNAHLALLGVPAHTISTSKMDEEPNYHKVTDEVSTLDLVNMREVIEAIAISSEAIIQGKATPSRVESY